METERLVDSEREEVEGSEIERSNALRQRHEMQALRE